MVATYRPHSEGLEKLFGSLEADIMEALWARGSAPARDVFEDLREHGQRISYGAVKTVMDRLVAKSVLRRAMDNGQYSYTPVATRDDYTNAAIDEILVSLIAEFPQVAVDRFVACVHSQADRDRLRELLSSEGRSKAA